VLLGGLPANWLAWRKRTVWLPMATHVMVNLLFSLPIAAYMEAAS
jgi:membrane protease YdiL (CAAX protease family)